jgi:hypothetical protein
MRLSTRRYFALVLDAPAIIGIAAWIGVAWAQDQQLAPKGRGLLPRPTEVPAVLGGTAPPHPFVSDPSGGLARTLFETDEDPNFRVVVRDFSFPPGRGRHSLTLRSAAFLHLIRDHGVIAIGIQRFALINGETVAVSAGTPNNGEQHVVVRAVIVEAK